MIRDKSMDTGFVKHLRTEYKSLIAEVHHFGSDPDPLSQSKMASLEARIRSLKGLSPIKVDPVIVKETLKINKQKNQFKDEMTKQNSAPAVEPTAHRPSSPFQRTRSHLQRQPSLLQQQP
ncbi:hypothetical protein U1Q18_007464 [Sarracenia purpurea var. burkii]